MKKIKLLLLLFLPILFIACTSEEHLLVNNNSVDEKTKEITVGLNFSVIQNEEEKKVSTRGLSFDLTETGAPTLNLANKEYVKVNCVFFNSKDRTFAFAPLNFRVVGPKELRISQGQKFALTLKQDPRMTTNNYPIGTLPRTETDEWYVMGIIGDNASSSYRFRDQGRDANYRANLTGYGVSFDHPFNEVASSINTPIDFDVPFAFLWRKLKADVDADGNYVFTAEKPALVKPLGVIVRLSITNKTGFPIKYNGFTLISSGSTTGAFVLDLARYLGTEHQAPESVAEANNNATVVEASYAELIRTMWVSTEPRGGRPQLTYTRYALEGNNDVTLQNNQADDKTYWVWFLPQEASKGRGLTGRYPNLKVQKTQFLLHSKAVNSADPEVAMLPVYGSKFYYVNGNTYKANGSALYHHGPLNYLAKENITKNGTFSNTYGENQVFTFTDMASLVIPTGYHIPTRMEWQAIFPRYAGLGNVDTWGSITPVEFEGTKARFMQYGTGRVNTNTDLTTQYHHIVTLVKEPTLKGDLLVDDLSSILLAEPEMGLIYSRQGSPYGHNYNGNRPYGSSFNIADYPLTNSNLFQTAIRIDHVNIPSRSESTVSKQEAHLLFTQRYLGPNFILTPYDIQDDRYWKYTGRTDLIPLSGELQRALPMWGYNFNLQENGRNIQARDLNIGYGAIYLTNTDASTEATLPVGSTAKRLPIYLNLAGDFSRTDNTGNLVRSSTYRVKASNDNSSPLLSEYNGFVRLFSNTPMNR